MMTHTPEPWYYEPCSTANCWCGTITTVPGSDRTEDGVVSAGAMKQADVLRAIACVNACAGITDPIAIRREHGELLKALKGLRACISQTRGVCAYEATRVADELINRLESGAA